MLLTQCNVSYFLYFNLRSSPSQHLPGVQILYQFYWLQRRNDAHQRLETAADAWKSAGKNSGQNFCLREIMIVSGLPSAAQNADAPDLWAESGDDGKPLTSFRSQNHAGIVWHHFFTVFSYIYSLVTMVRRMSWLVRVVLETVGTHCTT